jgi:predicted nucleic-acid-binding protein
MKTNEAFIDTSVILRILTKDDKNKMENAVRLIKDSAKNGIYLHVLPVALIETVFVLEKIYKFSKLEIKELIEGILNTPELHCELDNIFRQAVSLYSEKNIKFGDALMSSWAIEKGISVVYAYDMKDFKRVSGLEVKNP